MQPIIPNLAVKTTSVIISQFLGQEDGEELSWVFLAPSVSLSGSQACWQSGWVYLRARLGQKTDIQAHSRGCWQVPLLCYQGFLTGLPYDLGAGFPQGEKSKRE